MWACQPFATSEGKTRCPRGETERTPVTLPPTPSFRRIFWITLREPYDNGLALRRGELVLRRRGMFLELFGRHLVESVDDLESREGESRRKSVEVDERIMRAPAGALSWGDGMGKRCRGGATRGSLQASDVVSSDTSESKGGSATSLSG